MNIKLNQLGNNFSLFIWWPEIKGQGPWNNYLHIKVPPNRYKELSLATMLQPTNSKVAGIVNVFKPGVNPEDPNSTPHAYWTVSNSDVYYHTAIHFPEPGTYILAVQGKRRELDENGRIRTEFPSGDENWGGWVALLGKEFVTIDNQIVPFDTAMKEGFSWGLDVDKRTPQPTPPSQPPLPPLPQSEPSDQPGSASQTTSQPSQQSGAAPQQAPPQVVYVQSPQQPPEVYYVEQPKEKKRKGLRYWGCLFFWVIISAVLVFFVLAFLGRMAP